MITAVIIDDEKKAIKAIKRLIKEIEIEIEILNEASSVDEGFKIIEQEKPQLIFLDVEMLDGTGFNLLEKFDTIDFKIIFTTAYDHYAVRAFKYSAIDYLLKPINIDEFEEAIIRAKKALNKKSDTNAQINALFNNLKKDNTHKKIIIKSTNKMDFIEVKDIIYCSAESTYTEFVLSNNKKITTSKPLRYFDTLLTNDFPFFRASRTHLINMNYIESYQKGKEIIELGDGIEIEISRRRRKDFLDLLKSL